MKFAFIKGPWLGVLRMSLNVHLEENKLTDKHKGEVWCFKVWGKRRRTTLLLKSVSQPSGLLPLLGLTSAPGSAFYFLLSTTLRRPWWRVIAFSRPQLLLSSRRLVWLEQQRQVHCWAARQPFIGVLVLSLAFYLRAPSSIEQRWGVGLGAKPTRNWHALGLGNCPKAQAA